ncbi:MAG TPA: carbon-nitrogen hydrolase family protein [Gaiellaceae bacterium]
MPDSLRVACIQLTAGSDKAANLEQAERLVTRAVSLGAELVVLPEKWNLVGDSEALQVGAETLEQGESVRAMADWAKRQGVVLVGGSIVERREGREKLSNTSLVFDASGELIARYRKLHLFDVEVAGQIYRESASEESGDEVVLTEVGGWKIGLTICYDLRFPELYRLLALAGAELVTVPANFTLRTGMAHWHTLLRARAIENALYLAAPGQIGEPTAGRPSYGHSLVVDPWGTVIAEAPDTQTVIVAELERSRVSEVRSRLPVLSQRRPDVYRRYETK